MTETTSVTAIETFASPLATVQDIQRRLLRPSSLRVRDGAPITSSLYLSLSASLQFAVSFGGRWIRVNEFIRFDIQSGDHSQFKEISLNKQQIGGRGRERRIASKDKKLEDYLDPYLLYITASKISRTNVARTNFKIDALIDSEFPVAGLGLISLGEERSNHKRRRIQGNDGSCGSPSLSR